jgi:hypothetical protein
MSLNLRLLAATLLATAGVAVFAGTPTAFADSLPDVVDGPADVVIDDLTAQGYNVSINWTNGFDTKPLSDCTVTGVNDPGDLKPSKTTFVTVYVDVVCPNHDG